MENTPTRKLSPFYAVAGLLVGLSIIFTCYGIYKMYDNSYSAQIVGGDAYNFIIYATRATAWICAGICAAVLSIAFTLFAKFLSSKS